MLTIVQLLQQIIQTLVCEWDTLVRKIGKRTANILLTCITLGLLFEGLWLTLIISVWALIYILN